MYVDYRTKKSFGSGDLRQSNAYTAKNYLMPTYLTKQSVVFVQPSANLNQLFSNNTPQILFKQDIGNKHEGSNFGKEVNDKSFILYPFQKKNVKVSVQSNNTGIYYNTQSPSQRTEIPSLNTLANNIAIRNYDSYLQNPVSFNLQRLRHPMSHNKVADLRVQSCRDNMPSMPQKISSPPREEKNSSNFSDENKIEQRSNIDKLRFRKRNHSESSTESVESRPLKLQRISEDACFNRTSEPQRKENFDPRIKHSSPTKNLKIDHCKFNINESYNMKRLNLGENIENGKAQQELKSRLKAMKYSYKVLREDKAIVVPSLPSILSYSSE